MTFFSIGSEILDVFGTSVSASSLDAIGEFLKSPKMLAYEDKGTDVRHLQSVLLDLGYITSGVDGYFGPKTRSAVVAFQKAMGLTQDGIVGPATKSAMLRDYLRKNPPSVHTVKKGETLSSISGLYGIDVRELQKANGIRNIDYIYPGQVLLLKAQAPVEPEKVSTSDNVDNEMPEVVFPSPTKGVCLTFNDGPNPVSTRQILDVLDSYGVPATFFLIGEKTLQYPDLAEEIVRRGHVVGIHGFDHRPLSGLSEAEVATELKKAKEAVFNTTGMSPWLYRPPKGVLNQTQVKEASRLGLTVLMWTNIGGADLGASSPQEVFERIIGGTTNGGTLLLHEGLQNTLDALPQIIETLARMGYGFQNPLPPRGWTSP